MSEHYYSENPSSEIREKQFTYAIDDNTLSFKSVSGVFSFEQKVDKASELLIKNFIPSGKTLLDLGCGYGAIGLFLKVKNPEQNIYMIDINSRAVEYAAANAYFNKLEVIVKKSDLFENVNELRFDDVVSNPPLAAGKKLNTELIMQSYVHLNSGGALWLVAFHNKGGSTLKSIMESHFGNVEDIEKKGGIRVYRSVKRA